MDIDDLLQRMTLEEKAALLQGQTVWTTRTLERLHIPAVFLSDGPHGLRKQAGDGDHLGLNASVPATCFPAAATMANTWNPDLGEAMGEALGEEAAANDVHVLLGPGLNIKRSPLCGRNFEYFSEDPYLSGKMAAAMIRGIQRKGVAACPKHFAVNSQELRRMCMDAVVDERTLREIYLTGFEIAVKEGRPKAIMTSYNRVNGVYANENAHLLRETEGMDRESLNLSPAQQALLRAVCAANPNVVLVFSGGAPFVLPAEAHCRAAIHGYLGGQAGAGAMADALLGAVNPGGKLNETWPESLESCPATPYFPSRKRTAEYREGLYVGYRYFDTVGAAVRYPFGHGLSYTEFAYSDLNVTEERVSFTLENCGRLAGAEVAQVYVSCRNGHVFRPKKELKGFQKVTLRPGESKTVVITLDDKAFRYFNVKTNSWETEAAEYEICVGASAADLRLRGTLSLVREPAPLPYGALPHYRSGRIHEVTDAEFEELLGHAIPDGAWSGELGPNDAVCQLYTAKSGLARLVYRALTRRLKRAEARGMPDLNLLFIYNMPLRAIAKMAGGAVSRRMVDDLVYMINGHFWRGLVRLICHYIQNKRANKRFEKALEGNYRTNSS